EFRIIGDTDAKNYEIELVSERTQTISSQTKNQYSGNLNQGVTQVSQSGNTGYRYASYKIKKVNGEQVSTEPYLASYYPARDTIVTIGTKEVTAKTAGTSGNGSTAEGGD
ncbi:MAG: G5 domain-containing protein, partial [Neofamilia sp.]